MSVRLLPLVFFATMLAGEQPFYDRTHESKVFGEARHYRIFLPPAYETSGKRYPVLYYFHGSGDRYTLEKYDNGLDTVPKISAFVATHEVIVVAADGYIAKEYSGFYGGRPYDVDREGGDFDYGQYFLELIHHIDSTYRTLTSRRYRATSGLSMGGFMSLYLSARYPELVGSASAFNPGPEFYVGEKGQRSLWRPKDHVLNHERTLIRLVRASGDYISQYHEETRSAYAITPTVDFEYRQDEYNRHWATSISETFDFHLRAFANPALDVLPVKWNYDSGFSSFHVWGYHVEAHTQGPAISYLEHVTQGGLGIRTRRWAPDGPPAACESLDLITAPLYQPGETYRVFDYDLTAGKTKIADTEADQEGRIHLHLDCSGHEVGFAGPGTGAQEPILLPLTKSDVLRPWPGQPLSLPVRIFNPHGKPLANVHAELSSAYPTVEVIRSKAECSEIAAGQVADLSSAFQVRFVAGEGDFTHARLQLKLAFDNGQETKEKIDVSIAPANMPSASEIAILDGRTKTFPVFRQKDNGGGGDSVERTVTEGAGNGNGVLEPGESATIWVRLKQGLDPFDKNNWCRAKVYADSRWLTQISDIQESKGREWTSAQSRTSLVALSSDVPPGTEIPMILDCESWSFDYTPDVRYGKELLYQAFQFHKHHLFAWKWNGRL
jgi:pimeloyl-ACP methyl ester carboxylesterase